MTVNNKDELRSQTQQEAISQVTSEMKKHKVIFIDAPAGSGKSFINLEIGNFSGSAYVTTPQVPLVDQYYSDLQEKFKGKGWAIKGRQNYPCPYLDEKIKKGVSHKADVAPCTEQGYIYGEDENGDEIKTCPIRTKSLCPYYRDRDAAMKSPVSVMTFHYFWFAVWMALKKGQTEEGEASWNRRKILVIDEAHNLPDDLVDFFTIKLEIGKEKKLGWIEKWNRFDIEGFSKEVTPVLREIEVSEGRNVQERSKKGLEKFKEFLDKYLSGEKELLAQYQSALKDKNPWSSKTLGIGGKKVSYNDRNELESDYLKEKEIIRSLDWIHDQISIDAGWIFSRQTDEEKGRQYFEWRPLEARPFLTLNRLWDQFDNIILSSATFLDYKGVVERLGLSDFVVVSVPAIFDPSRSPIEFVSSMNLYFQQRNERMPEILNIIKDLADKEPFQKGLVHCTSGQLVSEIREMAKNYSGLYERMVFHPSKKDKREILEEHKKGKNSILVAVKIDEGLDFPDDDARWQVIVVAPYLNPSIPWVRAHENIDLRYNQKRALIKIMQASGRIVRHPDDWGVTYIIDNRIQELIKNNYDLLPDWFTDRINFRKEPVPDFDQWRFVEVSYRNKAKKRGIRLLSISQKFVSTYLKRSTLNYEYSEMRRYVPNWRILRNYVVRHHDKHCDICKRIFFEETGRPEVDHIVPIADGGLEFDINNLRVVCHQCNMKNYPKNRKEASQ